MKVNLARRTLRIFDQSHPRYGERIEGVWAVVEQESQVTLEVDEAPPFGYLWNGDEADPKFFLAKEL